MFQHIKQYPKHEAYLSGKNVVGWVVEKMISSFRVFPFQLHCGVSFTYLSPWDVILGTPVFLNFFEGRTGPTAFWFWCFGCSVLEICFRFNGVGWRSFLTGVDCTTSYQTRPTKPHKFRSLGNFGDLFSRIMIGNFVFWIIKRTAPNGAKCTTSYQSRPWRSWKYWEVDFQFWNWIMFLLKLHDVYINILICVQP